MVRGSSLIKYIKAGGIYTSTGGTGGSPQTFYILLFLRILWGVASYIYIYIYMYNIIYTYYIYIYIYNIYIYICMYNIIYTSLSAGGHIRAQVTASPPRRRRSGSILGGSCGGSGIGTSWTSWHLHVHEEEDTCEEEAVALEGPERSGVSKLSRVSGGGYTTRQWRRIHYTAVALEGPERPGVCIPGTYPPPPPWAPGGRFGSSS